MTEVAFDKNFPSYLSVGRYVAVREYAHLAVRMDLRSAIQEVGEACDNIRRTTDHARQKAQGMDIHSMMNRQESLCNSFMEDMNNQLYALGNDVKMQGVGNLFELTRGRRQDEDEDGRREDFEELVARLRSESADGFLEKMHIPEEARDKVGLAVHESGWCGLHDLVSDESSEFLQARCKGWYTPELDRRMERLKWTPEGQEINKKWEETRDVYYFRKNFERLMTMRPWTKRLYVRRFGEPVTERPVYPAVSVRMDASRGFKEREKALAEAKAKAKGFGRSFGKTLKKIPAKPILKLLPKVVGKREAPNDEVLDREERQAAILGGILGGFVLENRWEWIKNQLGFGSGTSSPGLVKEVEENDEHVRLLGDHVSGLEKETMKLRHQVTTEEMDERLILTYERVVSYLEEIKEQYRKIHRCLSTLVSTKRLSTAVVSPPEVYHQLTAIAQQLRGEGMELLMEEKQEVYEMETSYVLFENMTLAIFVHLPVGKLGGEKKLYRYIPTPFRFENRTELFMVDPPRELLASSTMDDGDQIELSAVDFEMCDSVRSTYYCPGRSRWSYDTRLSCLTALFRRDASVMKEKCPLTPIPHEDMSVQLDEKTFVLAIKEEEVFRFICNDQLVTSMKMSGLIRMEIPRDCVAEGEWMKLLPTHDLFYNVGKIKVVKVDPLGVVNGSASDWAMEKGDFSKGSGASAGPSVDDLMKNWKTHTVQEKQRLTFAGFVKRCLWGLLAVIISVAVGFVCLKGCAFWALGKKVWAVAARLKVLKAEAEAMASRMTEVIGHVSRLSSWMRGEVKDETVEEDRRSAEELPLQPRVAPRLGH